MKVTITGDLYSGKTSLAKKLCAHYNLNFYTVGLLLRKNAENLGMSITEYNEYMNSHNIDDIVDKHTEEVGLKEENFIYDARLAWHFIKDSIKIYLKVHPEEAARRALMDSREAEKYASLEEAKDTIIKRTLVERERFNRLYGVDIHSVQNYDLILDTTVLNIEEVFTKTTEFINNYNIFKLS